MQKKILIINTNDLLLSGMVLYNIIFSCILHAHIIYVELSIVVQGSRSYSTEFYLGQKFPKSHLNNTSGNLDNSCACITSS